MKRSGVLTVFFFLGISLIASAGTFTDIPDGHWAYKAADELSARGILIGFPDGAFHGEKGVNRYHLAAALSRTLSQIGKMIEISQVQGNFNNQAALNLLTEKSLLSRYPIRATKSKAKITRFELVLTLFEFFESVKYSVENNPASVASGETTNTASNFAGSSDFNKTNWVQFSDVNSEHWAYTDVTKVTSIGIMGPYGKRSFKGGKAVSKIQFLASMEKLRQQVLPLIANKGMQTASANFGNSSANSYGNPDVSKREIIKLPAKVAKVSAYKKKRAKVRVAKTPHKEKIVPAPVPEVKIEQSSPAVETPAPVDELVKQPEPVVVTADSNNSTEFQKPAPKTTTTKRGGDDKNYFRRGFN